jgi:hypothetical protein
VVAAADTYVVEGILLVVEDTLLAAVGIPVDTYSRCFVGEGTHIHSLHIHSPCRNDYDYYEQECLRG